MKMQDRRLVRKVSIYSFIFSLILFIVTPSITLAQLSGAALTEAQQSAAQAGQAAAQAAIETGATASDAATAAATAAANSAAAAGASATQVTATAQAAAGAATTAAQTAAMSAGAKIGTATTGAISAGTITAAALVAAAIAGIAFTSGGDDIVIAAAAPVEVVVEPTVGEAVDDLLAALSDSDKLALANYLANASAAEQAAFDAFITELDADSLAIVQSILAGASVADLEAVIAALTTDGELTRAKGDGYYSLCVGESASVCEARQAMYELFMQLSPADRTTFVALIHATLARGGQAALDDLAALMSILDATKLAALQVAMASGHIDVVIAAVLHDIESDPSAPHVTTIHHGGGKYTTVYHH